MSPEEVAKCTEKYNKSKSVHSIMRHVAEKIDMDLEQLYERVGWPLYRKYGHAFDAFKLAIKCAPSLFSAYAYRAHPLSASPRPFLRALT